MTSTLIDLARFLSLVLTILIFARVILSWVNPDPRNPAVNFIYRATEPLLAPVRNLLPSMGGMDFSPILVLVAIQLAESLIIQILRGF